MGGEKALSEAERRRALSKSSRDGERKAKKSASYGKTMRKAVPRDVLSSWTPLSNRDDSGGGFSDKGERQTAKSAFAFFCAGARAMAADLSHMPTTGIEVQMCGNAHVANFGVMATPADEVVFDIIDYGQTCRGPWEWDVARLCASIEVCGREFGYSAAARREAVFAAARAYREAMRDFASMGTLKTWKAALDVEDTFGSKVVKVARRRYERRLDVLASPKKGSAGVCDVEELCPGVWDAYLASLPCKARFLLESYRLMGAMPVEDGGGAREVVVLLEGSGKGDVFGLRIMEACEPSIIQYVAKPSEGSHAQRVVFGQAAMQAAEDVFLGWATVDASGGVGAQGTQGDFYVQQLCAEGSRAWMKSGSGKAMKRHATACGWTLAHAHARTGNRHAIAAYLGKSPTFEEALWQFAQSYAHQNEASFKALR